jgi:hypothetical protein
LAKPPAPPPTDYFVPNFGEDKEITGTKNSISAVEQQMGHFWLPTDPPKDPPRDYPVANFGMDSDIVTSLKNLNDQEKVFGPMHAEWLQLDEKRDPLLTWAPKWHGKWKINYPVPNFGADVDIAAT